jgi:integrase
VRGGSDDKVAQGNAVRNVAKLVDRVAGDAAEMRTLTERDMFRILDHECRDRRLWALPLYGLRRGEIAGLRWTNVDLKAKPVRTVENRVAVGAEIMSGIQGEHGTLPLPDDVVDVLRAARKGQTEERLACGSAYGSGEYVASGEFGQPSHPNLLTSRGGRMLDALGIERVRLHDARSMRTVRTTL